MIRKVCSAVALARAGVCVAVVMVSVACAQLHAKSTTDAGNASTTLQAAEVHLKDMVDATANVVGVGFSVQPDNVFLATACEDSAGRSDGTVSSPVLVYRLNRANRAGFRDPVCR